MTGDSLGHNDAWSQFVVLVLFSMPIYYRASSMDSQAGDYSNLKLVQNSNLESITAEVLLFAKPI